MTRSEMRMDRRVCVLIPRISTALVIIRTEFDCSHCPSTAGRKYRRCVHTVGNAMALMHHPPCHVRSCVGTDRCLDRRNSDPPAVPPLSPLGSDVVHVLAAHVASRFAVGCVTTAIF